MSSNITRFVYDIPPKSRFDLCEILDFNDEWKTLAGVHMGFDCYQIFRMEQAVKRRGSPTDELLTKWGSQNNTVRRLFEYLRKMKHYRALSVLKPYVDPVYHACIPDGCSSYNIPNNHSNVRNEPIEMVNEYPNSNQNKYDKTVKAEIQDSNQPTRNVSDPVMLEGILGGTPHIPYHELAIATNNWNDLNIIGRGGFGAVYKGLRNNSLIAVKKLEVHRSARSGEPLNQHQKNQTLTELKYLNSCRHDNILPLYGVCFEEGKYCLIYQFMPNGSLEDRLLLKNKTPPLSWPQRLNIAKGTALGLQFLHSLKPPLIHGDIKSHNILLNAHMEPVIGDFGLTQEGPIEKATHITLKRVNGTKPYLPHEFLTSMQLSVKVDVYGFGIVLFQLASGMRAYDHSKRIKLLKDLIDKCPEDNNLFELYDKNAQPIEKDIAYTFLRVGKMATKQRAKDRPDMIEIYNLFCKNMVYGESTYATSSPNTKPTVSANVPKSSGANSPTPNISPSSHKFQKQPDPRLGPPSPADIPSPIQLLQNQYMNNFQQSENGRLQNQQQENFGLLPTSSQMNENRRIMLQLQLNARIPPTSSQMHENQIIMLEPQLLQNTRLPSTSSHFDGNRTILNKEIYLRPHNIPVAMNQPIEQTENIKLEKQFDPPKILVEDSCGIKNICNLSETIRVTESSHQTNQLKSSQSTDDSNDSSRNTTSSESIEVIDSEPDMSTTTSNVQAREIQEDFPLEASSEIPSIVDINSFPLLKNLTLTKK